ncbi:MAG TPA: Holliday junction resolvase Hjc [archaeon]|nr:Holliday junction resolvase Hjc [archaeon]
MTRYNKGANAERELIKLFWERGFAVARTAGSGKNSLPMPDLIAMGKGRSMVIEAKAWRSNYLTIAQDQMHELLKWNEIAGAEVFVAWKYPNKGWFFLKPQDFRKAKHYSISFEDAKRCGVVLDVLVGSQSTLPVQGEQVAKSGFGLE